MALFTPRNVSITRGDRLIQKYTNLSFLQPETKRVSSKPQNDCEEFCKYKKKKTHKGFKIQEETGFCSSYVIIVFATAAC